MKENDTSTSHINLKRQSNKRSSLISTKISSRPCSIRWLSLLLITLMVFLIIIAKNCVHASEYLAAEPLTSAHQHSNLDEEIILDAPNGRHDDYYSRYESHVDRANDHDAAITSPDISAAITSGHEPTISPESTITTSATSLVAPFTNPSSSAPRHGQSDGPSSSSFIPLKQRETFDRYDPFALTFSDYLEDSKRSSLLHEVNIDETRANDLKINTDLSDSLPGFIVEDESTESILQSNKTEAHIIQISSTDFSHSSPNETKAASQKNSNEQIVDSGKNTPLTKHSEMNSTATNSLDAILNEDKLLFSWKVLPTHKCSRQCGRGYRVNHISCVDLKYDVRVENELCVHSSKPKPKEISQDPCNEHDCAPEWTVVNYEECNHTTSINCITNTYKQMRCTMVDRYGQLHHVPDSMCNEKPQNNDQTTDEKLSVDSQSIVHQQKKNSQDQDILVDFNIDEIASNNDMNEIVRNVMLDSQQQSIGFKDTPKEHPHNEAFFDTGPWSECLGAECGQLGKRHRNLTCRLFLSRSSKLVELPSSSCNNAVAPDNEEPCYFDCAADSKRRQYDRQVDFVPTNGEHIASAHSDETVYDIEMTRFIWKSDKWTKCSAECLGGIRESIVECFDSFTESNVEPTLCEHELKPKITIETCNDDPCPPEWRIGRFSKCSRSCGSDGMRTRHVECVQQISKIEDKRYMVVTNDLCLKNNQTIPYTLELCNRINCKPEWTVGAWSSCNSKPCSEGFRTRNITCFQEFATRDGIEPGLDKITALKSMNHNLIEAIAESAKSWYPSKATEVPLDVCYEEYKTIPSQKEWCFSACDNDIFIESDGHQNFSLGRESIRRKTITLKVGGQAKIFEGRNLKIRCKVFRWYNSNLVKKTSVPIEWDLDGVQIFSNESTIAEKVHYTDENTIFSNDVLDHSMTDDVIGLKQQEVKSKNSAESNHLQRRRNIFVRSWNRHDNSNINLEDPLETRGTFSFVPRLDGRFILGKEYTLRINKLRTSDSGNYTCSYGTLRERLTLQVVSSKDIGKHMISNHPSL